MAFTIDECVSTLMSMGYAFNSLDDGSVLVKQPAKRNPRSVDMVWYLTQHKDELRQYIQKIEPEQMRIPDEVLT